MSFTSFYFLLFFTCLLGLYYIVPGKCRLPLLVLASLAFCYFADGLRLLLFLSVATVSTWIAAIKMEETEGQAGRNLWFYGALLLNLGVLAVCKYLNFFVYTGRILGGLFHRDLTLKPFSIIAPLGISFYTFQVLGYLIDVSRGTCKAQRSLLKYAAFACFFPQLVTGPINRYPEMAETLYGEKKFDYTRITFGLQRIAWGFFKKLVISERLAVLVNTVYGDYHTYNGLYILFAAVCFTFQLYTDFSGAMDIALGVSEALGVKMAENFDTPFFSRSCSEFWRRWHITLGGWMRDYLFYPLLKTEVLAKVGDRAKKLLGKKRGKKVPTYLGMLVLWFTVGLWHGGSWNFIVGSGLLHFVYIVGGQLLEPAFRRIILFFKIDTECYSYHLFQRLRTFALITLGWVFFRASSFHAALSMLKSSLYPNIWIFTDGSLFKLGLDAPDFIVGVLALGVLLKVSVLRERLHAEGTGVRERLAGQNLVFRWILYYVLLFSIIIFGFYGPGYDPADFIYQGF